LYWFVLLCGWALTAAVIALVWMHSKPGRTFMSGLVIGLFAGVLWPITLWVAIGAFIAGRRTAGAVPADLDAQLRQAEAYVRQAELEGMAGQAQYWRAEWDRLNALRSSGASAVRPPALVVLGCTVGALITIGALAATWPTSSAIAAPPSPLPTPSGVAQATTTTPRPTPTVAPTTAAPTGAPTATPTQGALPTSGPTQVRRSGAVTVSIAGSGIDLDSPRTDPQWSTDNDDLDYYEEYFYFSSARKVLYLGTTPAGFETCRNTTGYTNGQSIDIGTVSPGDNLCIVTDENRMATVRILGFDESAAQFDIVVYDPPLPTS
jgi:hypothetical protein